MPKMPVNKDVLDWALNDAGVSPEEAAQLVGKSAEVVGTWLDGSALPFQGDLQAIASRVGRSVQFFFLPEPPAESGPVVRFRAAIDGESSNPARELKAIREATSIQKLAAWAAELEGHPAITFPAMVDSAVDYARTMRAHLGWTLRDQITASSKSRAYKDLRLLVEQLGIVVVYIDAGENNCRGFSLPGKLAPLIALNSKFHLGSMRSFTLLHELAHLARGSGAVCHDDESDEERWCNEFAAAFLVPAASLRDYMDSKGWTFVQPSEIKERVRLVANRYHVSWQAAAIRLRQLGFANQALVDEAFTFAPDDDAGFNANGGRRTPEIRFDQYGTTFTRAILGLRAANRLSEFDTRQQLHVNRDQLSELRVWVS
jgi:Zn-dependent peptidase ImmA (M78 family)